MKRNTLIALATFIATLAINASANNLQDNLRAFQSAQDLDLANDAAFGLYYEKGCNLRTEKACSILRISKDRIVSESLDIMMLSEEEIKNDLSDSKFLIEMASILTSVMDGSGSNFSAPKRMKSGEFKGAMYSVNVSNYVTWLPFYVVRGDKVIVRKLNNNEVIAVGTEGPSDKIQSAVLFERLK